MVVNTPLDFISQGNTYAFDRLDDLWTLAQHLVTAKLTNVVQIDVDGLSDKIEIEEVNRRAALPDQSSS